MRLILLRRAPDIYYNININFSAPIGSRCSHFTLKTMQREHRTHTNSQEIHVTLENVKIKEFYLSQQMKNESNLTWKDVVKEALSEIDTSGHLDDIYSKIKGHTKTETNPTWRDTVRRTLQQYSIFIRRRKGAGYGLSGKKSLLRNLTPRKIRIQRMKMFRGCCLNSAGYTVMKLGRS